MSKESIVIARSSHPTDNNVHEGVDSDKENGSGLAVSLGGKSAHDSGKGIGIVATDGGHIRDDEGMEQSRKAMPPFTEPTLPLLINIAQ
jgi:alcohol dehydrogenase